MEKKKCVRCIFEYFQSPSNIKLTKEKMARLVYGSVVNRESIGLISSEALRTIKGASKEEAGIQIYSRSVFGRRWE